MIFFKRLLDVHTKFTFSINFKNQQMQNKIKIVVLLLFLCASTQQVIAQFKYGITDFSIAVQDMKFGVPFIQVFPIHPGIEAGVVFLKNEKNNHQQTIGLKVGYIHHDLLITGPYLRTEYQYQQKIKSVLGINGSVSLGYLHAFYPGDGYQFSETSGAFEPTQLHQAFFTAGAGIGLSYLQSERVRPFLHYEMNMVGSPSIFIAQLKLGATFTF